MHYFTYRLIFLATAALLMMSSCTKDAVEHPPPSIQFVLGEGYVSKDTTIAFGSPFRIGIQASNPSVNLTNFIIKLEGEILETVLDSGMNTPSLSYEKTWLKGLEEKEIWRFIIRDRDGKSSEISVAVSKSPDTQFGPVHYAQDIHLGAQLHDAGSFFSLTSYEVYDLEQAFLNQTIMDLCYYYDFIDTDENTVASPGANIDETVYPGEHGLIHWDTRRTARFKKIDITADDFYAATNDSLLVVSYGQSDGNRKAKNLTAGDIFSFKNEDGRMGMFLVNFTSGTDQGDIRLDIKIQDQTK